MSDIGISGIEVDRLVMPFYQMRILSYLAILKADGDLEL